MSEGKQHFSTIVREYGGEARTFALPYRTLAQLEKEVDCGPLYLLATFSASRSPSADPAMARAFRLPNVRQVLFFALIGGGMTTRDAKELLAFYFEQRPLDESLPLAIEVLTAAIFGTQGQDAA